MVFLSYRFIAEIIINIIVRARVVGALTALLAPIRVSRTDSRGIRVRDEAERLIPYARATA